MLFQHKQEWPKYALLLLMGVSMMGMLTACGSTSVFKSLSSNTVANNPSGNLEEASKQIDKGNYTDAKAYADKVINDTSSTSTQKSVAYTVKGVALLGESGLNLLSFSDALISDSSQNKNMISLLPQLNQELIRAAAESFNLAELSASGLSVQSVVARPMTVSNSNLSQNSQFSRGVANACVLVEMVTRRFDISASGVITPKTGYTNLTAIREFSQGAVNSRPYYYAGYMYDAFYSAGSVPSGLLAVVDKVYLLAWELNLLSAALNGGTSYSYPSGALTPTDTLTGSTTDETRINNAAKYIFSLANK